MEQLPGSVTAEQQIANLQSAVHQAAASVGVREGRKYVYFCGEKGFCALTKDEAKTRTVGTEKLFSEPIRMSAKVIEKVYESLSPKDVGKAGEFAKDLKTLKKVEGLWGKIAIKTGIISKKQQAKYVVKSAEIKGKELKPMQKLQGFISEELKIDQEKLAKLSAEKAKLENELVAHPARADIVQQIQDTSSKIGRLTNAVKENKQFKEKLNSPSVDLNSLLRKTVTKEAERDIANYIKDNEKEFTYIAEQVELHLNALPADKMARLKEALDQCLTECKENIEKTQERIKELKLWGILSSKNLTRSPKPMELSTGPVIRHVKGNTELVAAFLKLFHQEVVEEGLEKIKEKDNKLYKQVKECYDARAVYPAKYLEAIAALANIEV